jgi:protein TorT
VVKIVVTKWGYIGKENRRTLVQEVFESHPDVDYIVGKALMAEAAISTLLNWNVAALLSMWLHESIWLMKTTVNK